MSLADPAAVVASYAVLHQILLRSRTILDPNQRIRAAGAFAIPMLGIDWTEILILAATLTFTVGAIAILLFAM
jgi:hypothetical protein